MTTLKLPTPASGAPKSGLVQFGDQLPGVYITAEDAFDLRLKLDGLHSDVDSLPIADELADDEVESLRDEVICLVSNLDRELGQLRQLLNQTTFGSAAHVASMLKRPGGKLDAAA